MPANRLPWVAGTNKRLTARLGIVLPTIHPWRRGRRALCFCSQSRPMLCFNTWYPISELCSSLWHTFSRPASQGAEPRVADDRAWRLRGARNGRPDTRWRPASPELRTTGLGAPERCAGGRLHLDRCSSGAVKACGCSMRKLSKQAELSVCMFELPSHGSKSPCMHASTWRDCCCVACGRPPVMRKAPNAFYKDPANMV